MSEKLKSAAWQQSNAVSADKDKKISELESAVQTNHNELMELAIIATDKEAAIKELVEGLDNLMKGVSELPPLTAIAGVLEKEYSHCKQLIQKHKQ